MVYNMILLYVISGKGRFSGSQQLWGMEELMDFPEVEVMDSHISSPTLT